MTDTRRNPFRMRTAEQIESDTTFLKLFSPGVLDLLPKDGLWDRVQLFRSAPGGGKTSLLRVFSPSALVVLHALRAFDDYKDLYQLLTSLGVISADGPRLLGITLSCIRNYAALDGLSFDQIRKERLFYALLNARMILAMLRGTLILKGLNYPEDLGRLNILTPEDDSHPIQIPLPASGVDLFNWAHEVEKDVCKALDSFCPPPPAALVGHDTMAFSILKPANIVCDNVPVADRVLVMLDDVHKLTSLQRRYLFEFLLVQRPKVGVWLAERLEALSPQELLSSGVTAGREYGEPIVLEDYWKAGSKRFENIVRNIADRRVRSARAVEIGSFSESIQGSVDGNEYKDYFVKAINVVSDRLIKRVDTVKRYGELMHTIRNQSGTYREQAIAWRDLEILIERDIRKKQHVLDFALPFGYLEKKDDSKVRAAADYFVSKEFGVPYYYGMFRLAILSSTNIEQFLSFAGDLFEEIASAALMQSHTILSPHRQHSILEKAAEQRWVEIPRRIPRGRDVQNFLRAIGEYACRETCRPTAPYAPGVTGIAMTMADRDKLIRPSAGNKRYRRLLMILAACISHNLLGASMDCSQGQRGKTWMVLYLNRWLCVYFGLPLQYGGWRSKTPDDLCRWLDKGIHPRMENGSMFV